jgi:hypothetical protein
VNASEQHLSQFARERFTDDGEDIYTVAARLGVPHHRMSLIVMDALSTLWGTFNSYREEGAEAVAWIAKLWKAVDEPGDDQEALDIVARRRERREG